MVLGISLRGKSKKKDEPTVRSSPSLPSVLPQGIPWPENLVDINDVKAARDADDAPEQNQNEKTTRSFLTSVPFHKPFRAGSLNNADGAKKSTIASFYTNKLPQNSGFVRGSTHNAISQSRSQRRRIAPTFNIMVAGARGTGKTSLLKLFLDTSEISSTATPEQKLSVESFMSKSRKSTRKLQTACAEIAESRFDRILLTLVDTPGLAFDDGQELVLERSVSALVKYLDMQYNESMGEESKVIRQNKGDQHVHLCIYLIDPASIQTVNARRAKGGRAKSQVTISLSAKEESDTSDNESSDGYEDSRHHSELSMNPAEIRVIKRLAARVNVLPVIARTDSLTESRLRAIKRTVRRELNQAGIGFSVLAPVAQEEVEPTTPTTANDKVPRDSVADETQEGQDQDAEEDSDEREARPVIRIRSRKSFSGSERPRSRSRRRRSMLEGSPERSDGYESEQPPLPDGTNTSTTPARLSKSALQALLPFALVSPHRRSTKPAEQEGEPASPNGTLSTPNAPNDLEPPLPHTPTSGRSSVPPPSAFPSQLQSPSSHLHDAYDAPREFPRGVFVRNYKWGQLDVLNPAHCDFVAMRNAVLSTHFRALKTSTREVLYEKYRTDKLMARRATRNIGTDEKRRLLQELGI